MKKYAAAIIYLLFILSISSNCPADNCESDGCYTSKGALIQCGGSWDDVYDGVTYHCTCVCGPCSQDPSQCVSASGGISSAGGTSAGQANIFSDTQGTAFFSRNQAFDTGDWADNNAQKWEAFEARVLQSGYADMSAFINSNPSGMAFNDFVYQATLKYLNNNYFNSKNGDNRLVRDDSAIPNASFYQGYNNSMKLPSGFAGIDDGGIYVSAGKPVKSRGADEDAPFEEREKSRLNSAVDASGGDAIDESGYDSMRNEASKQNDAASADRGLLSKTYDIIYEKIDDKARDTAIDTLTGLLSGGNENIKTALGSAVDAVQNADIVLKPINAYNNGNDEELGTDNLNNMKSMLFGQLGGVSKTIAKYSTKIVETFSMKTLNYAIKTIGDGLKILKNNGNPLDLGN